MSPREVQLVVIAKEPLPGFVKTRLCPPCTEAEAAQIAEAALARTLDVVRSVPATRHVLALDGTPGGWLPAGFEVIAQRPGGLGARLQGVFDDCFAECDEPVIILGMDTPQVRGAHLHRAASLLHDGSSAVLGPASDGGYWLIGLRHNGARLFDDVPMSVGHTRAHQVASLRFNGYTVAEVDELRDIDLPDDALHVARSLPGTPFAELVRRILRDAEEH
jgi:rSAM/selenodomain-associated transferase 1